MTEETTQRVAHVHRYEPKGGFMWWAECECGEKLGGENGVLIVRSKAAASALIAAAAVQS